MAIHQMGTKNRSEIRTTYRQYHAKDRSSIPILPIPFVSDSATNLVRSSLNPVGLEARMVELKGKSLRDIQVKNRLYDVRIGNTFQFYGVEWTKEKEKDGTREYLTWPDQSQETVVKYSENPLDSMKELYLFARSLMGFAIISVDLFMNSFEGQCREIVDSLRSTFDEVTILRIFGEDQRQEEIQYILDNMKHTNQLEYLEMNLRILEDCVEVAMKDIPYEIRHSIPTP
ncbi:hypothetical protein L3Y34_017046 [Caenorhabditis briggsae]|uniref:Uncharacterized protein n=1 Tax=Caenorhabditis briggsae TaxID=6238 RepID=A0AAE9ISG8_CAEBR|nr:hypothetical protein L3Y34_017046 [Caenorhabditis briggsae]